jgi:hypothetical protein
MMYLSMQFHLNQKIKKQNKISQHGEDKHFLYLEKNRKLKSFPSVQYQERP